VTGVIGAPGRSAVGAPSLDKEFVSVNIRSGTGTCLIALCLVVAGCSPSEPESTPESQVSSHPGKTFEPQYIGGYPTVETAERMFEEYDYQAAVQFNLWGYAYLNTMGLDKAFKKAGGNERSLYIFDKRIQPQHMFPTANSEVIYTVTRLIDLSRGPVVFEVPPRVRGHFIGADQRAYSDCGDLGPDGGKGGKYVVVANEYTGELPEGYFPVRATYTDQLFFAIRSFPAAEGSVAAAVDLGKQLKFYYLSEQENPPENEAVLIGDSAFSQEWPRDERAFEWLSEVFNNNTVPPSGLAHLGNMRRLGIEVGKPFNPDERARKILRHAAKTAEAMILSMAFRNRLGTGMYDNRQYERTFYNTNNDFFGRSDDGKLIYEEIEARVGTWHLVNGNFATVVPAKPGTGGLYMQTFKDKDGEMLIGSNTYRLHVPADVPVEQFWQIPVYDLSTRSMINNGQRSTITGTDDLRRNGDGSADIYFGPRAPAGFEQNWIKTSPGEGWFTMPRLYAPLEPILDRSWRWNDIERIE